MMIGSTLTHLGLMSSDVSPPVWRALTSRFLSVHFRRFSSKLQASFHQPRSNRIEKRPDGFQVPQSVCQCSPLSWKPSRLCRIMGWYVSPMTHVSRKIYLTVLKVKHDWRCLTDSQGGRHGQCSSRFTWSSPSFASRVMMCCMQHFYIFTWCRRFWIQKTLKLNEIIVIIKEPCHLARNLYKSTFTQRFLHPMADMWYWIGHWQ